LRKKLAADDYIRRWLLHLIEELPTFGAVNQDCWDATSDEGLLVLVLVVIEMAQSL
jgi:hypothetical protein